jgi:hypothetical protein
MTKIEKFDIQYKDEHENENSKKLARNTQKIHTDMVSVKSPCFFHEHGNRKAYRNEKFTHAVSALTNSVAMIKTGSCSLPLPMTFLANGLVVSLFCFLVILEVVFRSENKLGIQG